MQAEFLEAFGQKGKVGGRRDRGVRGLGVVGDGHGRLPKGVGGLVALHLSGCGHQGIRAWRVVRVEEAPDGRGEAHRGPGPAANDFPPKTVQEFIDYAKKNPGKVRYGTVGIGSYPHYDMAYFAKRAGDLDLVGLPNKNGASGVIQDMLRGDVQAAFLNVASTGGTGAGRQVAARSRWSIARGSRNIRTSRP